MTGEGYGWRIDVLDADDQWLGVLGDDRFPASAPIQAGAIEQNAKGSRLTVEATTEKIDTFTWIEMRLRPVLTLAGTEYRLGTFLPWLPPWELTPFGVRFKLAAQDKTLLLASQMTTSGRIAGVNGNLLPGGTSIVRAVEELLAACGISFDDVAIADPLRVLVADRAWDLGTSYHKAIDELLGSCSYYPIRFDRDTQARSQAQVPLGSIEPKLRINYDTDPGVRLSGTPREDAIINVCSVISEDDQRGAFGFRYTDDSPASPISTVRTGFRRCAVIKDNTIQNENAAMIRCRAEIESRASVGLAGDLEIPLDLAIGLDLYDVVEITSEATGPMPFLIESFSFSFNSAMVRTKLSTAIETNPASTGDVSNG